MHALRDRGESLRTVVDGVHRGHHRQQHLRGADVRGRLLAPDVLLAGLQRQPVGRLAARVDRDADEAPGHGALERVAHGHVGGVRAAVAHRHAEALGRADRDVGAQLARRRRAASSASRSAAMIAIAPAALQRGDHRARSRAAGRRCPDTGGSRRTPSAASRSRSGSPTTSSRCPAARRACASRRWSAGGSRRRRRSAVAFDFADALRQRHRLGGGRAPRRAARRWRRPGR